MKRIITFMLLILSLGLAAQDITFMSLQLGSDYYYDNVQRDVMLNPQTKLIARSSNDEYVIASYTINY